MPTNWDFGDEPTLDLPFAAGDAYCHHCGAPAPEGVPGPHDRCVSCRQHLHVCRNCMFDHGLGCLLPSPYRSPLVGLSGQDCPTFVWRDDDVAASLDVQDLAHLRE